MKKPFALITDRYSGTTKQAVHLLSSALQSKMGYAVLPVLTYDGAEEDLWQSHTVLAVGCIESHPILKKYADLGLLDVPKKAEGYAVYVGRDPLREENDVALIAGHDESGVLYGCADFIGRYLALLSLQGYMFETAHFERLLEKDLPPYTACEAPRIGTRAIWTWGHMIYDYRAFFENMARLRLNEAVIWNDRCPINAEDVVSYAHSLGIKIVWGFAWGWDQSRILADTVAQSDDEKLRAIKEKVLTTFEKEYKGNGDGIYFQSFTELNTDTVNGKSVADLVVRLVNDTASELLARYPDLHVQFGLHATSVKTKTDIIAKTDPRLYIVWEDCGAFPYDYHSHITKGFEETLALQDTLLSLRGETERFGAVLKGLVCLDWERFQHFSHPYVMGAYPHSFIARRTEEKRELWKSVSAGWMRNADYARRMIAAIAEKGHAPVVEMLVEDGCFEEKIPFPVALMAELFWSSEEEIGAVCERVARYPFVFT